MTHFIEVKFFQIWMIQVLYKVALLILKKNHFISMDMVFIVLKKAHIMKDIGPMEKLMEKEKSFILMETNIMEISKMIKQKDMDNIYMPMALNIEETLKTITKVDMVKKCGQMDPNIKGNIPME